MSEHSLTYSILAYLPLLFISYKAVVYIQRLYFHPLSKFPGPRICAASRLYEFYWDSIHHGRLWTRFAALHDTYGPIVRIGPDELHIRDSEYFQYLFSFKPYDKWAISGRQFGLTSAMFGTEEYKLYTQRRAAFGDAFSKTKSLRLQPLVNEKTRKGCEFIEKGMRQGKPVDLAFVYRAITAEIITEYMYGQQYGFFEDEKMTKGLYDRRFDSLFGLTHLGRFIPFWIPMVLILLRSQIKGWLGSTESSTSILSFMGFAQKMLDRLIESEGLKDAPMEGKDYKTAGSAYLHSNLPKSDKTGSALVQATMAAWSGGWDTTAFGLTLMSYYLLNNPQIEEQLRAELTQAWPSQDDDASMKVLDDLPYLNAVIKESMRLMHGALTRLTRINPTAPEQYQGWTIPPGTKISMSLPDINNDKAIWGEDVDNFRPERWLRKDSATGKTVPITELDKHLATFSRGTRVCAGIELAWMELKMILATLVRRYEMKVDASVGIDDGDVLPYSDCHTPGPKNYIQRLPVLVSPR